MPVLFAGLGVGEVMSDEIRGFTLTGEDAARMMNAIERHLGHEIYTYTYGFHVNDPEVALTCLTCNGEEIVDLTVYIPAEDYGALFDNQERCPDCGDNHAPPACGKTGESNGV